MLFVFWVLWCHFQIRFIALYKLQQFFESLSLSPIIVNKLLNACRGIWLFLRTMFGFSHKKHLCNIIPAFIRKQKSGMHNTATICNLGCYFTTTTHTIKLIYNYFGTLFHCLNSMQFEHLLLFNHLNFPCANPFACFDLS